MLFVVHPKKIKIRRFRERHIIELRAEDVRLVIRSRTTVARPLARVQSSKARDAGSTPSQTCQRTHSSTIKTDKKTKLIYLQEQPVKNFSQAPLHLSTTLSRGGEDKKNLKLRNNKLRTVKLVFCLLCTINVNSSDSSTFVRLFCER